MTRCVLRRIGALTLAATLLAVGSASTVSAAPGDLDTTFSGDGVVEVQRGRLGLEPTTTSSVVQSDGKILTIGVGAGTIPTGIVTRLLPDGRRDTTFGTDGSLFLTVGGLTYPTAAIRQGDTTVIVGITASSLSAPDYDIFVMRLTKTGARDTTFGPRGTRVFDVEVDDVAWSVAAGPSGSILVGGAMGSDAVIMKVLSTGALDPGFAVGGLRRVATGIGSTFALRPDIARTASGGAVIIFTDVGYAPTPATRLVRVTATGAVDTSFGGTGEVIRDVSTDAEEGREVLVVGSRTFAITQLPGDAWITALAADGSTDTSWGVSGQRLVPLDGTTSTVEDALRDSSGRFVIAGDAYDGSKHRMQIARVGSAGAIDTTFAGDGTFVHPAPSETGAVAVVERGTGYAVVGHNAVALLLAAVRRNGTVATTFGTQGLVRTRTFVPTQIGPTDVSIQPDNKVITLAQTTNASGDGELTLIRLRADGRMDTTFGVGGIVTLAIAGRDVIPSAVRRLDSGKYLVSMVISAASGYNTVLARFTEDGRPDTTFGPNGRRILIPARLTADTLIQLSIDGSGRAVVAAEQSDDTVYVVRVRKNGTLDTSFGTAGVATLPKGSTSWDLSSTAVLDSGRIGLVDTGAMRILRLRANGTLDGSYGPGGERPLGVDASFNQSLTRVRGDGTVMLALSTLGGDLKIARVLQDGSLDGGFGVGGITTRLATPSTAYVPSSVVQRIDGSVTFSGYLSGSTRPVTKYSTVVGRLDASGNFDSSFSGDGIAVYDLAPGAPDIGLMVSVRSTRLVVAGFALIPGSRLLVARVAT